MNDVLTAEKVSPQVEVKNMTGLPKGTPQHPMAIVAPVINSSLDKLNALLMQIRSDIDQRMVMPFEVLGTIHYLRIVLMDPEADDGKGDRNLFTKLIFATDFDGDEEQHMTALATNCGAFMDELFECCAGYPELAARNPNTRKAYFDEHKVHPSAFFAGAPGRTLSQVRQESDLRNFVWEFIHKGNWKGKSSVAIHQAVKQAVFAKPEFAWAKEKAALPKIKIGGLILMGIILLALLPFIIVWVLVLHFTKEVKDKSLGLRPSQVSHEHVRKLEEYEDWHNQNQFTQVLIMKPGFMRLKTLQGLMLFAKALVNLLFVDGKLMGIPTIHFARWQMLDDNRRMIFFSNFDGSWTQYLGDFIDKSGWGLTGIWSNTINFPKTRFLFTGGAYDAEHFLAWSRYYQTQTAVWYCAYPNLSIKNVMNNTHIRNGISSDFNEKEAQQFLNSI